MNNTEKFAGLTMPVFTAFSWDGEDTAVNYALSQLTMFINLLHASLPEKSQKLLPYMGLSEENQAVFLAANEEVEEDVHVAFFARPVSLELQFGLTAKDVLARGLQQIEKKPEDYLAAVRDLSMEWQLRVQQMERDVDSGETTHYQDIYSESLTPFDSDSVKELYARAAYLNENEKWVTPIYISRRYAAERISAMQTKVVEYMSEQVQALMPAVRVLSGRRLPKAKQKQKIAKKEEPIVEKPVEPIIQPNPVNDSDDEFIYVTVLKPLHIRKGFINLTPQHWPFFALNARTTTRPVEVKCGSITDEKSAMWRLQPTEMARLVLGPEAHRWLEENFVSDDAIQLAAAKADEDAITVTLSTVG